MSKSKKKAVRGAGVSITIPTEPMAGAAKDKPIMAVLVQDEGINILEYDIKEGHSIQVRVGGTIRAFMERVGDAPDGDMFLDADSGNSQPLHVEFEHALAGLQTFDLRAGQRLTLNPVLSRQWIMSATNWED